MSKEFRLPDLGEDTAEGEVVQVLVKEGDSIDKDQPVIELETDKALLEVPSPSAGKVGKIHAKPGQKLKVDDLILTIEGGGKEEAAKKEEKKETKAEKKKEEEKKAEAEAEKEKDEERKQKEKKKKDDEEKQAAKAREQERAEDEEDREDEKAEAAAEPEPEGAGEDASESAEVVEVGRRGGGPAAPSTRRFARELGVDLSQVKGSGPGGRISQEDVIAFVRDRLQREPAKTAEASAKTVPVSGGAGGFPELPDFSQWGEVERQPLSGIRKKTMQNMARAWANVPHVTQTDEADITELMDLRKRHAEQARARGGKLTVTVFVIKAVVAALKEFPQVNASLDPENEELILKKYYHIGMAVDTDHGLMVPVIRNADKKALFDLSAELTTMSDRARKRKVTMEELRGGTFTITNLGGLGGGLFTPIVYHPEVAILGVAKLQKRLEQTDNGLTTRTYLPLCLSYDHRIVDGADGVRFLRRVASLLEDPALLLLEQ